MAGMSYQNFGPPSGLALHVEAGSYGVCRKGDLRGPTTDRIPAWCEPDSGPHGVWQP